ncbi:unnamed protein product, partial [Didymodactylos carnosus]
MPDQARWPQPNLNKRRFTAQKRKDENLKTQLCASSTVLQTTLRRLSVCQLQPNGDGRTRQTVANTRKAATARFSNIHSAPKLSRQKHKEPKLDSEESLPKINPSVGGLCGLENIGNTCFMNSALQCLANITAMTQHFDNLFSDSPDDQTVSYAYAHLIKLMWSGENSSVTPRELKHRVNRSAPIFSDNGQQDSQEFINSLLDALHKELKDDSNESIVTQLFSIKTRSTVTCSHCFMPDPNDQSSNFLPLPLPPSSFMSGKHAKQLTLEYLLDDFFKEADLDGDYYCAMCNQITVAKQKSDLCSPMP